VLSGEKQRIERNYSFIDVCEWFAGRADLILLLFDPCVLRVPRACVCMCLASASRGTQLSGRAPRHQRKTQALTP
jgi:hypothetical protein